MKLAVSVQPKMGCCVQDFHASNMLSEKCMLDLIGLSFSEHILLF